MKDVLIMNLTRMGDLIQTTPVMAGLKDVYPDVRITLLINAAFAEICNYIPFVDRLVSFNMDGFIEGNRDEFPGLVYKYRHIENLLREINRAEYDCVINFTHTSVSAVLMSLIRSRDVRGFITDDKGHARIRHPWLRYFFNVVPGRNYNPYHLCDVYVKAGGAIPKEKGLFLNVPKGSVEVAESKLREKGVKRGDLVIGFQPGASDKHKMWATDRYAELAKRLISGLGAKVVLFGTGGERGLGEEIKRRGGEGVIDMVGKTSLIELASFLKNCNLLISNDSGTMHVATAVGTKVIGISLGAAYFRETGPYGNGHIVIESNVPCHPCSFHVKCKDMICNDAIHVDCVYKVVEMVHKNSRLRPLDDSSFWEGIQVYEAIFSDDGLLEYVPVIRRPLTKDNLFRHIYRLMWLPILDGNTNHPPATNSKWIDQISAWYRTDNLSELVLSMKEEMATLRRLRTLAERGLYKVNMIAEEAQRSHPDVVKIKDIWRDMPLIEEEIETLGLTHLDLRPIVIYFKFGKQSLEGEDIATVAMEACTLYSTLIMQTSMIIGLIERMGMGNRQ